MSAGSSIKAARKLIDVLSDGVRNHGEYDHLSKRVDRALERLNALWTNPADVAECNAAKRDLVNAWNKASNEF